MMKIQNFMLVLLVSLICACDSCKQEECECLNNPTVLTADNTCICPPDLYYQVGKFTTTCEEEGEVGKCVEKKDNTFVMTSDCNCTGLTSFESTIVELGDFLNYTNERTIGAATSTTGIYVEKSDGNEFEYHNIKSNIPYASDECSGSYTGLQGFLKGKFNADNTFCEAKIYWRFDENGVNQDSCTVIFQK